MAENDKTVSQIQAFKSTLRYLKSTAKKDC